MVYSLLLLYLIFLRNAIVRSAGGNVSLTGKGAGTLNENTGVYLNSSTVESTAGNGTVTITGTGGNGTESNKGIDIFLPALVNSNKTIVRSPGGVTTRPKPIFSKD
ncbi:hypothetical protein [Microcoleus vaginatus]|uniref:hypothetical protein n=1 Tax=Microcoleus vaginatus TaxID=119532 RepID=UPI001F607CC9